MHYLDKRSLEEELRMARDLNRKLKKAGLAMLSAIDIEGTYTDEFRQELRELFPEAFE